MLERQQDEQQLDGGVQEFTEDDLQFDASYVQKLNEFLQKTEIKEQPTFYLYKYENYMNGEAKAIIAKFCEGDPPDEDTIGKQFGSGRYLLCMAVPKTNNRKSMMRAYKFRVHAIYDKLKESSNPVVNNFPVQQFNPDQSISFSFNLIEKMITILQPLISKTNINPDMGSLLVNNYQGVQEILQKQMFENIALMGEVQRKALETKEGNMIEVEEDSLPSVIEQIMPLLNEWLPKLLGNNTQAKAVSTIVKSTPQFKQLIANKVQFRKLLNHLDNEQGKEKVDILLKNLGLKR